MAIHPGQHQRGSTPPLRRRPRERVAGGVFQAVTRMVGFRPGLVPEHMRRQLRVIGVTDELVERVLPTMRSLSEWPYAWEAEGDARAAAGEWDLAFACWYVAQRILLAPSPLKRRLYAMALEAYERVEQPAPLERFEVRNERGDRISGYLQLPPNRRADAGPVPCVLIVPGITGTKEELHPFAMPLLRRGMAVARIDNPVYGETDGLLDPVSTTNARVVLDHLAGDSRLDAEALHLYGMSLGANFATQSALGSRAATLTVICPPFEPSAFFRQLPTINLTALQHMTGLTDLEQLMAFVGQNDLTDVVPQLTIPIRIFHGGRDRTIPVDDGRAYARATGGPSALTIYERDHHTCLEHLDEISALALEFMADPYGVCERAPAIELVDDAASVHVTDMDAALAHAGEQPMRRLARLPFLLPGVRPRSAG